MDAAQDIKVQIISNTKYSPSQTSTIELTEEEQIFEYKAKEETTVFVVIPPDGGWGWIVVTAAFFSFLIADGMIYTFGIFILDMSETLNCSKSDIVLVGGITTGFFCITGPFTSALINRFGYRKIAIMGSALAAVACLLTANAATLGIVYLTLGVLGGIGFGMIYLPAVIAVGFYFERLRALATGIAVCGSGMGGIILPVILTTILNESGWRYTYKIMSILCGSCAFSGYLFKPLKPTKVQIELEDDGVSTITQETSKSVFNKLHNNAHPTIYEVHSKSYSVIVDMPTYVLKTSDLKIKRKKISPDDASRSGTTDNTSTVTIFQPFRKLDQNNSSEFVVGRMSYCTTSGSSYKNFKMTKPENSIQSAMASTTLTQNQLATVDEETKTTWICSKLIYELQTCFCTFCVRLKKCFTKNRENTADAITRPIYRDDIFYSGSLLILPEYQKYTSQSKCATSSAAASVEVWRRV